jgi:hypothetical protein
VLPLIVTLWLMVLYIRKCVAFNRDIVVDGTNMWPYFALSAVGGTFAMREVLGTGPTHK